MVQNLQRIAAEWIVSLSLAGAWVALILLQLLRGAIARRKASKPVPLPPAAVRTISLAERVEPTGGMRMAAMAAAEPSPSRGDTRTMNDTFDVVIIGGGPGGYNAAIRRRRCFTPVNSTRKPPARNLPNSASNRR